MTANDILGMSPVTTSVSEALVQQKQLKIVVAEVRLSCLAFTFFQKLIKTFSSLLDLHSVTIQSMYSNRVQDKWVGRLLASSLDRATEHVRAWVTESRPMETVSGHKNACYVLFCGYSHPTINDLASSWQHMHE
jgi:hypothetical protein